jgi:hypothetical protein
MRGPDKAMCAGAAGVVTAQESAAPATDRPPALRVLPVTARARQRAVRSTLTGARFDPLLPFETWRALGAKLGGYSNATCWWLGDWLAFGQAKYGRRYKDAVSATGLEYQTLRNYAVVARRYELSRRRDNLTFHHHAELCPLSDDEQDRWLNLATAHGWSRNELRRRVAGATRGVSPRAAAAAQLALCVGSERARRWGEAAARCDCDIEGWVLRTVDEAAQRVLEASTEPAADERAIRA